jgi:hypothetical protein
MGLTALALPLVYFLRVAPPAPGAAAAPAPAIDHV